MVASCTTFYQHINRYRHVQVCVCVYMCVFVCVQLWVCVNVCIMYFYLYMSSSSCSKRGARRVACSLILQVKLVRPSLPWSSYVPLSVWSVMQCLSWQSIFIHPLYMLQPFFLVLFYLLYYVLCPSFFPNTCIFFYLIS